MRCSRTILIRRSCFGLREAKTVENPLLYTFLQKNVAIVVLVLRRDASRILSLCGRQHQFIITACPGVPTFYPSIVTFNPVVTAINGHFRTSYVNLPRTSQMGMMSHWSWPCFDVTSLNIIATVKSYSFPAIVSGTSWRQCFVCTYEVEPSV